MLNAIFKTYNLTSIGLVFLSAPCGMSSVVQFNRPETATCHWDLCNCIAPHRLSLNWPISELKAMPQKMRHGRGREGGRERRTRTRLTGASSRSRIFACDGRRVSASCTDLGMLQHRNEVQPMCAYSRYMPGKILLGQSVTQRLEFSDWPLHSYLNMHISSSCFWFFWISGSCGALLRALLTYEQLSSQSTTTHCPNLPMSPH